MDVAYINAYLQQARAIIGSRTPEEIAYDDEVVAQLAKSGDVRNAIVAANRKFPGQALKVGKKQWNDILAHFEYLREHKQILKRLGIEQTF